jgi:NADPH:quinone reductase-like Zn-dependent oxidoreductase
MFAVYASGPSPEDPLASLVVGERPAPVPQPGWVPVTVAAASLNMHDVWTLRGVGIAADSFPMILGCDGAGVLADGTEVVIHSIVNAPDWRGDETLDPQRTLLTEKHQGTFADVVLVPEGNAVAKPPGLSTVHAAVMGTAWLTAYRMLFVKSGLRPGQRMLVQGASGGVSTALIQLGRAAGMTVWVTGRTEEKRALAVRLGAHEVFESGARLPARVDGVFETVGEATWAHSMRAVSPGGVIVCSGATSGPHADADLQRLFFLQIRVEGSTMGTRRELIDLLAFVESSGIEPQVGLVLPLERAEEGFQAMLSGATSGKIVFTP